MITITDAAAARFKSMSDINTLMQPRIAIVAGGCNGFEKRFSFDLAQEDDIEVKLSNGISVLIDPYSFEMLDNSIVDFKSSVTGNFFSIEIPHALSNCGCGSSFSL